MTKYILHGGRAGKQTPYNKKFFFEAVNGLPDKVSVLSVIFAKNKERWNESFKEDQINFSSASPQKKFKFILATDKISTFKKQIRQADIIYLKGGNTDTLYKYLVKIPNLKKLFSGKVIIGVSAGTLVLSKYYYSTDDNTLHEGLGVLKIKTFCHYTDDKIDKLKLLKKYEEDLETYALPEEKFIVIEQ